MTDAANGMVYEFDSAPANGTFADINDSIKWLRMPLPFLLGHINLWLLRDGDGWAVVDTGLWSDESQTVWQHVDASVFGGRGPTRVFVTHMHPDHVGMAGWLCATFGVELWMTRAEYYTCRVLAGDTGAPPREGFVFYQSAGFDDRALARYRKMFGMFGKYVSPMPPAYNRLCADQRIQIGEHEYEVLVGSGHSPEHACLYNARLNVILAGDQILPTISSNVSVWPTEPLANPLDDWLSSCRTLRDRLPEDVLVLPAHGKPFRGVKARLNELLDEHERGLQRVRELCSEPRRVFETFPALFKSEITNSNLVMATGEAIANLNYLVALGELMVDADADGVNWYQRV